MKLLLPVALLALAIPVQAQMPNYGFVGGQAQPWLPPVPPAPQRPTPEQRRTERDELVKRFGGAAGLFIKRHGEPAAAALKQCSVETGRRLLEVPWQTLQAKPLLEAVVRGGEPVALFIADHPKELAHPAKHQAFVSSPVEFAYELRDWPQQEAAQPPLATRIQTDDIGPVLSDHRIILCLIFALVLGFALGRKTKRK